MVRVNNVDLASAEYLELLNRYADDTSRRKLAEAFPGAFGSEPTGV